MNTPRAIACFTFDNMGEAADIGTGALQGPLRDVVHESLTRGYPALYALLERHAARGTFFVEGWNGEHHPRAVAEIVERGHELGMHGWVHERWGALDAAQERELAHRATRALEDAAGVCPRGFRAPGGERTAHTESVLKSLGYTYDASLGDGSNLRRLEHGLAQVPFVWPLVDGFYYYRRQPCDPSELRQAWLRELDRVAAEGGIFLTITHAFLTGVDEARLAALDAVMSAAVEDRRLEIFTVGEVAATMIPGDG